MKFTDIERFPSSYYHVDVDLKYLKDHLDHWAERSGGAGGLIMNPEWQRGHVWNAQQKTAFMEYFLKGGTTGKTVYFNCSSWQGNYNTPIYCVDGLQRLTAAMEFMDNQVSVFGGHYLKDFEDNLRMSDARFSVHMLKIKNKRELLKIYLDFNSGGTPHNPAELERIAKMISDTDSQDTL